jgi:plastocyanin
MVLFLLFFMTGISVAADLSMTVVDPKGKPVEDAVVWVPGIGKPVASKATIFQKQRQFSPLVTVLPVGSVVHFPNRDTVQHHVYSFSPAKKFDIPLYSGDAPAPVKFELPGVIALGCNIHDWMSAYIVVLDTTAFARTGPDGVATIPGIQAGATLQVWHPRLRGKTMETKSVAGGKIEVSLRPAERRISYDDSSGGY